MMRWLVLTLIVVGSVPSFAAPAKEVDKLMLQWTQLEQQLNQIELNWQQKEPLLKQHLALLKREESQLQSRQKEHSQSVDKIEQERATLLQEQVRLEKNQTLVSREVHENTSLFQQLVVSLPPFLQQKWQRELSLIDASENTNEVLEKQLVLLSQLREFNHRVALRVAAMDLPTGGEVEVSQFYLGLSQGWYVSQDGRFWGMGNAIDGEWRWVHQPESADSEQLLSVLAMLNHQVTPNLVTLPVEVVAQP